MTQPGPRYTFWIKHAAVFIAAIALVWLAGVLPGMMLAQGGASPAPPTPSLPALFMGLLSAWPILIALAVCQALTFHYVKRFATPVFLTGVFLLALTLAWRHATVAPV